MHFNLMKEGTGEACGDDDERIESTPFCLPLVSEGRRRREVALEIPHRFFNAGFIQWNQVRKMV